MTKTVIHIEPCHPSNNITDCTCYKKDQLVDIANALNRHGHTVNISSNKKTLWKNVDRIMRSEYGCKHDWCWTSTAPVRDLKDPNILHKTFRPRAPDSWVLHVDRQSKGGRYEWLSNFDIDAVLAQYEDLKELKDFKFYKSVPIDFEEINDPLSKVNVFKLQSQGINKFAVVFNLDKHDQSGSHWISLFCDLQKRVICFFDSYAKVPEREIQDFMAKICIQALLGYDGTTIDPSRGFQMIPLFNATRHQFKNAECGTYSLYVIISMLHAGGSAEAFDKVCHEVVDDDTMNSFRKRLFIDKGK